jgi:putative ABC transport system substrate-binding protein
MLGPGVSARSSQRLKLMMKGGRASHITAFRRGLRELGWSEDKNLHIEQRWSGGDAERMHANAAELVAIAPEAILAAATTALVALKRVTRTIPIVFAQVTDPVAAGFVESLARPGGNLTGLTQHEFTIGVKWLELLKEMAPRITRIAVLYDPENPTTAGYLRAMESVTSSLRVSLFPFPVRNRATSRKRLRVLRQARTAAWSSYRDRSALLIAS